MVVSLSRTELDELHRTGAFEARRARELRRTD
jgi:hypothetical protein